VDYATLRHDIDLHLKCVLAQRTLNVCYYDKNLRLLRKNRRDIERNLYDPICCMYKSYHIAPGGIEG